MGAPNINDISSLRFNDLTFILLTWRKWLVSNNASRQQMGINSEFKVLKHQHAYSQFKYVSLQEYEALSELF